MVETGEVGDGEVMVMTVEVEKVVPEDMTVVTVLVLGAGAGEGAGEGDCNDCFTDKYRHNGNSVLGGYRRRRTATTFPI